MNRSDEIKVGLFVLAALVLLVLALAFVGEMNVLQRPMNTYVVRTRFAGGVEEGSPVRYAGIKVGNVRGTNFDPSDPQRVVVTLRVNPDTPVRTDSRAKLTSLGMLGENYIEIMPGSSEADLLPPGSEIPVVEGIQWGELVDQFAGATEEAKGLLADARPRVNRALDNINDLTNAENRQRVRHVLEQIDQLITESRPKIRSALANIDSASAKIDKFMSEIKTTRENLDRLLTNWANLAGGDDAEVQLTLTKLRDTLGRAEQTLDEARRLLVANREHLDVTLENMRVSSDNIREFTDTIKQRPYTLIRAKNPPDRKPGDPEPAGNR
jgi:phospholipid/cholesterol/gamma-HCH transport system substrate-binding protein